MRVISILILAATFSGTKVIACTPSENDRVSDIRRDATDCSAEINYSLYESASLTRAEDWGQGFVYQRLIEGSCAGAEVNYVIQDCNTGRAAVFGEYQMPSYEIYRDEAGNEIVEESVEIFRLVKSAAEQGTPMAIDSILNLASEKTLETVLDTRADALLDFNGRNFKLGCGCQLFYGD